MDEILHNGTPVRVLRINTPATLRHVGMARVGNQLVISDGDTPGCPLLRHTRDRGNPDQYKAGTAPAVTGSRGSFGFWADTNFLYYVGYGGDLRIHRNSDNVEVARSTTPIGATRVGLTFIDGALYSSGEGQGQIRRTPLHSAEAACPFH